jgi:hypothetical protein
MIVSVLGSGWSVKGLDLNKLPGFVIGANDSGLLAPRVDAIVSMDRLWTENRWQSLSNLQRVTWIRFSALANIRGEYWWLRPFFNSHKHTTPSEHYDVLNGTNSGMCALNLAYLQRPDIILMFGFDHCRGPNGEPYWHKPYGWAKANGGTGDGRYQEWSKQYEPLAEACAHRGIKVFNCSMVSTIEAFPRVDPNDAMERFHEGNNPVSSVLR